METNEKKRIDFTTTEERLKWLKETAKRQEISVSQLLNRLIRNRMKTEDRFAKKESTNNNDQKEDSEPLTREILRQRYPDEDL